MPFLSKSQMAACFAKKRRGEADGWDCEEWADKTKNIKSLPEHVKKAAISQSFTKIAKELFSPLKSPPIHASIQQKQIIDEVDEAKRQGMTPVEYRNKVTARRTGIIQRNKNTAKAI